MMFRQPAFLRRALFALCLILISGMGRDVFSQSIYLEWVDDPLQTMVVNWVGDTGGSSTVEYRPMDSDNWLNRSGETRAIPGTSQKQVYTVKLSGLSAGQAYEFRVGGNGDLHKFRTAPNSLDIPIRFIVAGDLLDSGNDLAEAKQDFTDVSQIAATYNPYFVVLGGDLANANGNPDLVDQWLFLFETWHQNMVTDNGFLIPMVVAMGNNEVPNNFGDDPEDSPFFYTFFRYPQDQWGSKISYGNLDFNDYLSVVTLDSDHTHRVPGTQTNWLRNTLSNRRDVRHVVPVYHVAGWPVFRTFRGTQEDLVRNNWHPVFRETGIRLVFEHHDHNYKRTLTIGDCDEQINNELSCNHGDDAKGGVIYMGGGSWGSNNDRLAEHRWYHQKVTRKIHNFVVVEISNKTRIATAIGEDNQVLDEFTDHVFLDPPKALPASVLTENSFTARWEKTEGTTNYRIDVATEPDFTPIWKDFENKTAGNNDEITLTNLDPTKIYYYRVRAENHLTRSKDSEVIIVQFIDIDPDLSSLEVSKNTVAANDVETSRITATVVDKDGERVPNYRVTLFAEEGNLQVKDKHTLTNEEGQATFDVSNDRAEVVTYGARVGNEEITQKVQVTFVPPAPVVLDASEVGTREFTANWQEVRNADVYQLDVATDSSFSNTLDGYRSREVGNVLSHSVEGAPPGTTFYYRVRAVTDGLIGIHSRPVKVTTFPETPVATEASERSVISFRANWEAAEGAKNYRLDVAEDQNFERHVDGYENIDVENVLSYEVDGLLPGRVYYYRVRAEAGPRLSDHSNTLNATTLEIDTEISEIQSSQLRVLANGEQSNKISVIIRGDNGEVQEGVDVQLTAGNGNSQIEEIQSVTDEKGVATFEVTNTTAESVTYSVVAATVGLGEISVEFLEGEGELRLGDNFPNPFRYNTSIPLEIPRTLHVDLRVYNSLGALVRILRNEEFKTGYYEIPFGGTDLAAGVYFYRLVTEEGTKSGKMVLVK